MASLRKSSRLATQKNIKYFSDSATPSLLPLQQYNSDSIPCVTLKEPFTTFYKQQYDRGMPFKFTDDYQSFIFRIFEFDIHNNEPRLIGDIMTKKGLISESGIMLKSQVTFEIWISAAAKYREQLILKGWTSESEMNQYQIQNKFYTQKLSLHQRVYMKPPMFCACKGKNKRCKCRKIKNYTKVRINFIDRPKYFGMLTPPFHVVAPFNKSNISSGWCHGNILYVDEPNTDHVSINPIDVLYDVVFENILKYPPYIDHCFIPKEEIPLWCTLNSCWWDKKDKYNKNIEMIKQYQNNKIIYNSYVIEILEYLIQRTYKQTVKPTVLDKSVKKNATKYNLIRFAMFAHEADLEFKIFPYLRAQNVLFIYDTKFIGFQIQLSEINNILTLTDTIFELPDGSKAKLTSDIVFKWIRKSSLLMIHSFKYQYLNRHVANIEEDNEINLNDESFQLQFNQEMEEMI